MEKNPSKFWNPYVAGVALGLLLLATLVLGSLIACKKDTPAPEEVHGAAAVDALPGVTEHQLDQDRLTLSVEAPHVVVPALLRALDRGGVELEGLATRHTSLEDVFVHLTGRQLRDGVD